MSFVPETPLTSRRTLLGASAALASALVAGRVVAHEGHDHGATPAADHGDHAAAPAATPTPAAVDASAFGPDLVEPEVRATVDGVLETSLTAAFGPVMVNGEKMVSRTFEGSYPAPTLRMKPGETLKVRLNNQLDEITNLHTHGFHVSPGGNSDNVFVEIKPGTSFDFEFNLPADHMPGTYWYHPHVHGSTYEHVNGGMAGMIIVEGGLDELPGVAGLTERLLILQSTQFDENGVVVPVDDQTTKQQLRTINGQVNPTIRIRPGETQRWRLANMTSSNFCLLALEGHHLHQISADGNAMSERREIERLFIGPGERADILVQAGKAGAYEFRQLLWGIGGQAQPDVVLATMVVEGEPVDPAPLPTTLLPFEDLREASIDRTRELVFDVQSGEHGPIFLIDGQTFDHNRVDQTITLGATEEWVLRNDSTTWHPFHIHINDFQVVAVNGEPVEVYGWEDTIPIPPKESITIRHRFPDFTGKYVYHCHILFHEDHGMMGIVEVVE
ncbi:MAG TPA: multicopper oxidase family protein [Thermomicrobiales bacterium]|nr:multicopper oxidase family protein [Thermomicrobiales bacterium]